MDAPLHTVSFFPLPRQGIAHRAARAIARRNRYLNRERAIEADLGHFTTGSQLTAALSTTAARAGGMIAATPAFAVVMSGTIIALR